VINELCSAEQSTWHPLHHAEAWVRMTPKGRAGDDPLLHIWSLEPCSFLARVAQVWSQRWFAARSRLASWTMGVS
jgi:hypothetical protein